WTEYGQFLTTSGSGLQTRGIPSCGQQGGPSQCDQNGHNPNFTARYVRVWAVSGDGSYSVSELQLWNTSSQWVSLGKPTYGPEPPITNGEFANAGTSWNDTGYATILPSCGSTGNTLSKCVTSSAKSAAATVDLGGIFPVSQLTIQADQDDTYQVDSST